MGTDRFDFEDLDVFQRSLDLLERTDDLCRHFKGHRRGLGWHLFDASYSISLNIAEGSGRTSNMDRAHYLDIANGSAREAGGGVCIADRLDIGPPDLRREVRILLIRIISMLTKMTRSLRAKGKGSTYRRST